MRIQYIVQDEKEYIDKDELAKAINVTKDTAKKYILEVEKLIQDGTYPKYAILRNGKVLRVNYYAIIHYLTFADYLKNKNAKKHVPTLNIEHIREFLGHSRTMTEQAVN